MRKKLIILIVIALVAVSAGCNMIQVDQEKDMARVVVEVGDVEILKSEYNNYLTYHKLIYALNGYAMPEGDELEALNEDILNTMGEIHMLKSEAEKLELEVDMEGFQEEVDSSLDSFIDGLGETEYSKILSASNMTEESFKEFFTRYMEEVKYANAAIVDFNTELFDNKDSELEKKVMEIDGETITKDEFYYQLSSLEFDYYMNTGSGLPSDDESLGYIYDEILNKIAESRLMSVKADQAGISVSEEEISQEVENLKSKYATYFDEESLAGYLSDYYLTVEKYDELVSQEAQRAALIKKYQKSLETGLTVTSEEIAEYYEENKGSYDTSTVSAKHILTDSKEYADTLMGSIKSAETFETAFVAAQDDENIKEASDLGEFTYDQMVKEFSEAAFNLEKGHVTVEPVESQYGYHIIYVYDKNHAEIPSLEEKTDEIRTNLLATKAASAYTTKVEEIRSDADITKEEIKDPFQIYIEELKNEYNVKTYPSRVN
ncbi:SurA N-terminal domain-containing protein [Alkalibacter mobilis]|uniref:SurA N-terminal domain-containing protein n=1 Tax=Alkalibacter mobilis TaxID=2787712 RepID=UPI00189FB49E|nr:SurA N-terminal domain-containing protein [Alkalibacter mobilis]MBF7096935.1 SurA N-terminal domain-containing protein [Alkalibacter mobilis]